MEKQQLKSKSQKKSSYSNLTKTYIIINFLIAFCIGALGIIYGSFFLQTKYTLFVIGTVDSTQNCVQNVNSLYDCNFIVNYTVNGNAYQVKVKDFYSYNDISQGQEINLFVDPKNPQDVTLSRLPSWIGILLIIFGCIFVLYSIVPLVWLFSTPSDNWDQTF